MNNIYCTKIRQLSQCVKSTTFWDIIELRAYFKDPVGNFPQLPLYDIIHKLVRNYVNQNTKSHQRRPAALSKLREQRSRKAESERIPFEEASLSSTFWLLVLQSRISTNFHNCLKAFFFILFQRTQVIKKLYLQEKGSFLPPNWT